MKQIFYLENNYVQLWQSPKKQSIGKLFLHTLFLSLCTVSLFKISLVAQVPPVRSELHKIDGVYELIKHEVRIELPSEATTTLTDAEWAGLWIFEDGHFSETMMKRKRPFWIDEFPRSPSEMHYVSSAGTFVLDDSYLKLKEAISLYPQYVGRPYFLQFKIDGDMLILTEKWEPHVENRSRGTRIITLRKIQ